MNTFKPPYVKMSRRVLVGHLNEMRSGAINRRRACTPGESIHVIETGRIAAIEDIAALFEVNDELDTPINRLNPNFEGAGS